MVKLNPKIIFLIDSIGALATALLLSTILKIYNEFFGMPESVLSVLAIIAFLYCLYSFICFLSVKNNWRPFLMVLSIMNVSYCLLTFGLVLYHFSQLTKFGIVYFFGEIFIILGLVYYELKKAKNVEKIS